MACYLSCCNSIFYLPFVNELIDVSYFSSNGWNACCSNCPVILVSTNGDSHKLFGCTFFCSSHERGFVWNLLKDAEDTWSSFFYIVFISAVKWIDKGISIWVHIDNKWKMSFFALYKITIRHCLGFWEWCKSREIVAARILHGIFLDQSLLRIFSFIILVKFNIFNFSKINAEVSIDVNSNIFTFVEFTLTNSSFVLMILILSFTDDLAVLFPELFNELHAVNV